jgi:glucokinase
VLATDKGRLHSLHIMRARARTCKECRSHLAGDIGGTNAHLVLGEAASAEPLVVVFVSMGTGARTGWFPKCIARTTNSYPFHNSSCHSSLYRQTVVDTPFALRLVTPGRVAGNRINFTKRKGWNLDGGAIEAEFDVDHVFIGNDIYRRQLRGPSASTSQKSSRFKPVAPR